MKTVKKILSIALIVLMIGTIFIGCSNDSKEISDVAEDVSNVTEDVTDVTKDNESLEVPATYSQVGFGLDLQYQLNENSTYDELKTGEKGTFTKNDLGFRIVPKSNSNYDTNKIPKYFKSGDYYYNDNGFYFEKDREYGIGISLDENNRTNQTFSTTLQIMSDKDIENLKRINADLSTDIYLIKKSGKSVYDHWFIAFTTDGTFNMYEDIYKENIQSRYVQKLSGTYVINDNAVILTEEDGITHIMVLKDKKMYLDVLQKQ